MASMYSLPAYMPDRVDPTPTDAMYALPSYHKTSNGTCQNGAGEGEFVIIDPTQLIEKEQLKLISALTNFGEKLNKLLKEKGNTMFDRKEKAATASSAKITSNTDETEGAKKDKDAKKEARKAAKQEAKAKVVSSTQETSKTKKNISSDGVWIIKEEKRSTETGQSLTACMKPELADFPRQTLGNIKLTVLEVDLPWVNALSKVGEKRNVAFTGKVVNKVEKADSNVLVDVGNAFTLSFKEGSIKDRVAAWESLGTALGVYSFESTQAIQAAHQHQWLRNMDRVLRKELNIAEVIREMSQFLSRFDTLGSQFNVGLADILFRTLVSPVHQPSNVELWANRVDSI